MTQALRNRPLRAVLAAAALLWLAACRTETAAGPKILPLPVPAEEVRLEAPFLGEMTPDAASRALRSAGNGDLFIIVHPGYYFFVQQKTARRQREKEPVIYDFMLRQMANERHFVHRAAGEKLAVVLVLPGGRYPAEYVRYVNELTDGAETVVLLRSRNRNVGELPREENARLKATIAELGVRRVILGGGYIGRCQEHVYSAVSLFSDSLTVAIAPEISGFSPKDISEETLVWLTRKDGTLDFDEVAEFIDAHRMNRAGDHAKVLSVSAVEGPAELCLAGWNSLVCEDDLTAALPSAVPAF